MNKSEEIYFKIGEMAKIFDLSVSALRLYDKLGLFKPEYIDESNGYRYYIPSQVYTLNAIVALKNIGIKLMDIKSIFDDNMNPEMMIRIMERKKDEYENQIEIYKYNIESLEGVIKATEKKLENYEKPKDGDVNAYKMSRLVVLESVKADGVLSEVLWL